MLEGSGLSLALLAPAFPAQGRTVVDGRLRVDGGPVDGTAISRDPTFPPTGASVPALLVVGGVRPIAVLPLATVRRGPAAVAERLRRFARAGGRSWWRTPRRTRTSRSSWMRPATVPRYWRDPRDSRERSPHRLPATQRGERPAPSVPLRRPLVVVAGSAHPTTRAQIERLGAREDLIVLAPPSDRGADDPARRRNCRAWLADQARSLIDRSRPGTLLLTGGETAIAVLRALGGDGLRLTGELEPGVAIAALVGGPFQGVTVLTKAGGFGDADALVRVWEACA